MKKVCIVGGGNIGTAMCYYVKQNQNCYLTLLCSDSNKISNIIEYQDRVTDFYDEFSIDKVTSDYKEALENADVIFVTLPSFLTGDFIKKAEPFIKSGARVGFVPGSGGAEFYCDKLIKEDGIIVFGLDRVPCVSRLSQYGKKVEASKKDSIRCATIPRNKRYEISSEISDILNMECRPLDNYLIVTFTPSNPIVHTSRLYSIFGQGKNLNDNIYFYGTWDDVASEYLLGCDDELHKTCDVLKELDMNGVIPLTTHYEVSNIKELTAKMRSIKTMNTILSPFIKDNNGEYLPDYDSRYFKEDFVFGIMILKAFAQIVNIETPYMNKIVKWFEEFSNEKYFDEKNNLIHKKNEPWPNNFGIKTIDDIYTFYKD